MKQVEYVWNVAKAVANEKKHGISFGLASAAMSDPFRFDEPDTDSIDEERWKTLAAVKDELILLIVHTDWEDGDVEVIRIISARRATSRERRLYEQNRF